MQGISKRLLFKHKHHKGPTPWNEIHFLCLGLISNCLLATGIMQAFGPVSNHNINSSNESHTHGYSAVSSSGMSDSHKRLQHPCLGPALLHHFSSINEMFNVEKTTLLESSSASVPGKNQFHKPVRGSSSVAGLVGVEDGRFTRKP